MSYLKEFPDFELDVQVPPGFIDNSWHNDVCPHWSNPQLNLDLWIDYPKASDREMRPCLRFALYETDSDGERIGTVIVTDEYDKILLAIIERSLAARNT